MDEVMRLTAREAVRRLKAGDITPLELIDAALARIAETDGALNALPTLVPERARAAARAIMDGPRTGADHPGWLAGLPIAVKDLTDVAGVRTTFGSPIYADNIAQQTDA
ncbi:MAG: amidase family protein, partial [Acetobacterales bacterium]